MAMERTDSSSAMMSMMQYGQDDSDEDTSFNEPEAQDQPAAKTAEKKSPEKRRHSSGKDSDPLSPSRRISEDSYGRQSVGMISDEEIDHHVPHRKREHEDNEDGENSAVPAKVKVIEVIQKITPSVSPVEVDSSDSQKSKSQRRSSKMAMRLVSYGTDDLEDDENESEEESEAESSGEKEDLVNEDVNTSPGPRGLYFDVDSIQLPPEPPGKCSKELQNKIITILERAGIEKFDPNLQIQRMTSFRNPSIYDKLVDMHQIDEKGSNFKLDVFNPHMWGKDSFYDELDKAQKKDMERREKERKTKIEFISGTKKSAPSSDHSSAGTSDEKKRKSKWDALPAGLPSQMHRSGSSGSGMANLTTAASGTRATVISAVGTLTKKASYNIINSSGPYRS
ncbi:uncharacterized protein LOC143286962 [Babylonia areolata]|uniref:uncharacterized protein LOC143286962 n=1 Tax=Babylonia areolata TaxID=304850 RepID=UPI003FD0358D